MVILKGNEGTKLYYFLVFIGAIGIIDTISLAVFTNTNVGTLLPGFAGALIIAYVWLKLKVYRDRPIIGNSRLRKIVLTGMVLFCAAFLFVEGIIVFNSRSQEEVKTDYLIILGGGIKGDRITQALKERLDKGIEYLHSYPDTKVIVSGGKGVEETITEAEAMERYLLEKGIDPKLIIKEEKATSTMENFRFSREIIEKTEKGNTGSIMIVTNDFHMFRSKMLAQRNGLKAYGISCVTPASVWVNCYIREFFALGKSYFLDK